MRSEIEALLVELLETYGYTVINIADSIIRAEKKGEEIIVTYALPDETLDEIIWERMARIRNIEAEAKLFVNLTACQNPTVEVLNALKKQGVILLPRENFEREIGRAKLSKILSEYEKKEEEVKSELQYSPEERFFVLAVDRNEIEKIGEQVSGFNYELHYVPHHVYTYSCEIKRGGIGRKCTGIVAVDARNGQVKKWKRLPEVKDMAEYPGSLKPATLTQEEAKALANDWILQNERRELSPVEMKIDNIVVIEKRIEQPDPESIVLNYLGIIHLPIWYVEGSAGVIVVNGAEGSIIDLEFFGIPTKIDK